MTNLIVFKLGGSLLDLPDLATRVRRVIGQRSNSSALIVVGGGAAADAVRDQDRQHNLGDERAHWLAVEAMERNARLLLMMMPEWQLVASVARSSFSVHASVGSFRPQRGGIRQPRATPWEKIRINPLAPTGRDSDRPDSVSPESRPVGASLSAEDSFPRAAPWAVESSPVGAAPELSSHYPKEHDVANHFEIPSRRREILLPAAFLRWAEALSQLVPLPHTWDVTSDSIAAWVAAFVGASELVLLKSTALPAGITFDQAAVDGLVDPHFRRVAERLPRVSWCNLREPESQIVEWRQSFAAETA